MELNRFTNKARQAIAAAQSIAARFRHQQIDSEHLLLAILEQEEGQEPVFYPGLE